MKGENYHFLIQKLDEFIRKFYLNKLIKGLLYFLSLVFSLFLLLVLLEYFGNFKSQFRTFLFYGSLLTLVAFLCYWVLYPVIQILRFGKIISHEQASAIIGKHFSEVDDKLFNVLQLKQQSVKTPSSLIEASIDQKIKSLKPIPFQMAIRIGENKKYIKYLLPSLVIIGFLVVFSPKIISESTSRLVAHNIDFEPLAPFHFNVLNEKMQAFKNEDFKLKIGLSGSEVPNQLYIHLGQHKYLMNKEEKTKFSFTFKNMKDDADFFLSDGTFDSKNFHIEVLPKAVLENFQVHLDYPSYLKKKDETLENIGDLSVPEGTLIQWSIFTKDADKILFLEQDSIFSIDQVGENEFHYKKRLFKNSIYGLIPENSFSDKNDTVIYSIEVIPDLRPSIQVESKLDSNNLKVRYFKGLIKDDHGFSRLVFHHQFIGTNDSMGMPMTESIPFDKSLSQTDFYLNWNINQYALKAGDRVNYYFEVWDNDGINGSKSARTQDFVFQAPTKKELQKNEEQSNQKIKDDLAENIQLSKDIKKSLEELKESMLNKKKLDFQDKKKLEELLKKQKQLQQNMQSLNKENAEKNRQQEEYNPMSEEMKQKQQQIADLMEKVMTEDMKKMMDEIQKMMDKLQKDKLQDKLEKIDLSNEEMEKEMDRSLELFKRLEVEKQLNDAIKKLDDIKKEQEKLKKETETANKKDKEELEKKQEELNKEFEELSKDLADLKKKNEELEEPNEMKDTKSLEEQIKEDMKESSDELSKMQNDKAGEKQEDAQEGMDKLSQELSQMQMEMQSSEHAENLADLRALLENLIQLSFDQEDVMKALKETDKNDPKYIELAQKQNNLQDDAKMIEDSLFALSKRVVQLKAVVNREMSKVNDNMKKAVAELEERNTAVANSRQQLAMTSINNLALILDEAVQQMQMQMQSLMKGKGECKKPGNKPGGKPSPGGMKSLQQQLNKQMEQLKKAMEKGGKKPGQKPGKDGKGGAGGQNGMSKELAQMAAKQAQIRKAIQQMQEELGKGESGGGQGELKKLQDMMEKTETDLVNKQITKETILRQQEILSRLLESEKAEREREKDQKRKSHEATQEFSRDPKTFFEYNRQKENEIELLRTLPPSFSPFYKTKVTEYFNQLNQ